MMGNGEKCILIVEPEQSIRKLLWLILKEANYAATVTVDGAEALALLNETNFDLILLEIELPDMSGKEFLTRQRVLAPNSLVAIVSSHEKDYLDFYPQIM